MYCCQCTADRASEDVPPTVTGPGEALQVAAEGPTAEAGDGPTPTAATAENYEAMADDDNDANVEAALGLDEAATMPLASLSPQEVEGTEDCVEQEGAPPAVAQHEGADHWQAVQAAEQEEGADEWEKEGGQQAEEEAEEEAEGEAEEEEALPADEMFFEEVQGA